MATIRVKRRINGVLTEVSHEDAAETVTDSDGVWIVVLDSDGAEVSRALSEPTQAYLDAHPTEPIGGG